MYNPDERRTALPRQAILVGLVHGGTPEHVAEEHLDELAALAESAGVHAAGRVLQRRPAPHAKTFIGSGKAEEAGAMAAELGADLLLFDDDLSASQVKNLEEAAGVQVMDRSSLILELFSQRARTGEARTQVELARLNYLLPRLTRMWRHLSRQVGGIGVRGGDRRDPARIRPPDPAPADRPPRARAGQDRAHPRAPAARPARLPDRGARRLHQRRQVDALQPPDRRRHARRGPPLRDPRLQAPARLGGTRPDDGLRRHRRLHPEAPAPPGRSFRSTLDEIAAADLVLHVIDRSHPQWEDQRQVAESVLDDLGVERARVIPVLNKTDRLPASEVGHGGPEGALWVSAETGEGLEALRAELVRRAGWPRESGSEDGGTGLGAELVDEGAEAGAERDEERALLAVAGSERAR